MLNKETIAQKVARKLRVEGLTKANYTKEKAIAILNKVVAPVICIKALEIWEEEIIEMLYSK